MDDDWGYPIFLGNLQLFLMFIDGTMFEPASFFLGASTRPRGKEVSSERRESGKETWGKESQKGAEW